LRAEEACKSKRGAKPAWLLPQLGRVQPIGQTERGCLLCRQRLQLWEKLERATAVVVSNLRGSAIGLLYGLEKVYRRAQPLPVFRGEGSCTKPRMGKFRHRSGRQRAFARPQALIVGSQGLPPTRWQIQHQRSGKEHHLQGEAVVEERALPIPAVGQELLQHLGDELPEGKRKPGIGKWQLVQHCTGDQQPKEVAQVVVAAQALPPFQGVHQRHAVLVDAAAERCGGSPLQLECIRQ
jgi:hypothetical protein